MTPRSRVHGGQNPLAVVAPSQASESVRWEDGRPKHWPCLQLRVRGRPFDVYCEHSSDVTLDGVGIPVVNGHTVTQEDLKRGWFDSSL